MPVTYNKLKSRYAIKRTAHNYATSSLVFPIILTNDQKHQMTEQLEAIDNLRLYTLDYIRKQLNSDDEYIGYSQELKNEIYSGFLDTLPPTRRKHIEVIHPSAIEGLIKNGIKYITSSRNAKFIIPHYKFLYQQNRNREHDYIHPKLTEITFDELVEKHADICDEVTRMMKEHKYRYIYKIDIASFGTVIGLSIEPGLKSIDVFSVRYHCYGKHNDDYYLEMSYEIMAPINTKDVAGVCIENRYNRYQACIYGKIEDDGNIVFYLNWLDTKYEIAFSKFPLGDDLYQQYTHIFGEGKHAHKYGTNNLSWILTSNSRHEAYSYYVNYMSFVSRVVRQFANMLSTLSQQVGYMDTIAYLGIIGKGNQITKHLEYLQYIEEIEIILTDYADSQYIKVVTHPTNFTERGKNAIQLIKGVMQNARNRHRAVDDYHWMDTESARKKIV